MPFFDVSSFVVLDSKLMKEIGKPAEAVRTVLERVLDGDWARIWTEVMFRYPKDDNTNIVEARV